MTTIDHRIITPEPIEVITPTGQNLSVKFGDSPSIDAFGRSRVSQLTTQFDSKQLHDALPLLLDIEQTETAGATHSTVNSETVISTTTVSDYAIVQSKERSNYQSGKSHLIYMTFNNFHIQTNIEKRVGYFSSSTVSPFTADLDGIFLENNGTDIRLRIYRFGTSTSNIVQSAWDDPLDGTGSSGITVDWEKGQVLIIDFGWLGISRVRIGLVVDGLIYYFHDVNSANNVENVYMSSPNQPVRWEIRQRGAGSGSFGVVCGSISSEGSVNILGKVLSENLGSNTVNANSTASKYALLGIRLQAARVDTLIDLIDFSVLAATNDNQLIEVWLNPTVAGTFTYNNVTNSSVQIAYGDTGASASLTTVTGGIRLYSKVISSQEAQSFSVVNAMRLGMKINGTLDEIVLTTQPFTSNSDVSGTLNWRELT